MAPEVSGRIVELSVLDNQEVKKGQVLFQIDSKPYQLSVDQARAAVQGLEAELSVIKSEVASQTSGAAAAATGINSAEAQLELAASTLNRMQPLLGRGFVSAEQVDQARTAKETAQVALERARQMAAQAREAITSAKPTEAQLAGARASLALAERNLDKTGCARPSTAESPRYRWRPGSSQTPAIHSSRSSTPSIGMRSAISARPISPGSSPDSARLSM